MGWFSAKVDRFGRIRHPKAASHPSSHAGRSARRIRSRQLRLEGLEDRRLLSITTISNIAPIAISATDTAASPYPSNIEVSGLSGTISDINVTLNGFTHAWPDDVDIMLVGPTGKNLVVMSDVGSYYSVSGLTLTLDDSAEDSLPDTLAQLTSGTYQPTNCPEWTDTFPSPAPAPSTEALLSTFNGTDPNGTWSLYVVDDSSGDGGSISGGWSLTITTTDVPLTFVGASGDDVFTVNQEPTAGQVSVWLNGTSLGTFTLPASGELEFLGGDGNDQLIVNARSTDDAIGIETATITVNEASLTGDSIESCQVNALEGNDTFTFVDSSTAAGSPLGAAVVDTWQVTVSGGTGTDTLDYSDVTSSVTVNLQNRTASKVSSFASIEAFVGSSATDTLVGPDVDRTWNLTGLDAGTVGSTAFSSFENLTGGSASDSFRLKTATAGVSGQLDGGSGTDTLVGYSMANTWNLTGAQAGDLNGMAFAGIENLTGGNNTDSFLFEEAAEGFGTINGSTGSDTLDYTAVTNPITINLQQKTASKLTGFTSAESFVGSSATDTLIGADAGRTWYLTALNSGTVGGASFSSFENVTGGSGNDSFRVKAAAAGLSGELNGGGGTDTLTGSDTDNDWDLTGAMAGNLNGTLAFSSIKNLTGGSAGDDFLFQDAADGFGTIDGGNGNDTLDYTAVTSPVTVDLQQKTASKLAGFSSIQSFVGSSDSDSLIGTNANQTWYVTGLGTGSVGSASFSSFECLTGGSRNDSFHLNGSGELVASVDGGSGLNGLDYSFYGTPGISVDLQTGTATAIGSGLSGVVANMTTLVGTSGNDTLVGNDGANILFGGAGDDLLQGGAGRDILFGGSGADVLYGGEGEDILVGGITTYYNESSLSQSHSGSNAILAEWTRTDQDVPDPQVGYLLRLVHLLGGGGLNDTYKLSTETIQPDVPAVDQLFGDGGRDWFLASSEDEVSDCESTEIVTPI